MSSIPLKKFFPHILVLLGFWVSIVIYFYPMVFQGKNLRQQDILQYLGMAREIIDNRAKYHEEPFWSSSMFSGMPSTMISMEHFGNLIRHVHALISKITPYPSSLIWVSLVAAYILLLSFQIEVWVAVLGAYAFAFATFSFISLEAGHNAKVACMAYMPLVLAGMVWAYRRNLWIGASLLAVAMALHVANNHVQITYYLAFICLAYAGVEFFIALKSKTWANFSKKSLVIILAALLGLATHAGYFLTIQEYSKYSIRGKAILTPTKDMKQSIPSDGLDKEYVFSYSSGITEPLTWLIPNYLGGASAGALSTDSHTARAFRENGVDPGTAMQYLRQLPLYFGEQPFVAGPMYMGAVIIFLVVFSCFLVKDSIKYALLGCSILALLLTYGKNFSLFNYFLFDYFPLYNKFRSVTMAVVIPQVCFSLLAALALKSFFDEKSKTKLIKPLLYSVAITGGLCILVFVTAGGADYAASADVYYQFPSWLNEAIQADRKSMRVGDALRSALLIGIAGGLLWAYLKNKLTKQLTMILIATVTVVDLWLVNKRYLNNENFEKKIFESYYAPSDASMRILQDGDVHFRVLNLYNPFNDARTSYFHRSVGGYSPAKLRRYQDLIEQKLAPEIERIVAALRQKGNFSTETIPVLNMLDTRYIIAGQEADMVIPNKNALGAAWFVERIKWASNNDEEMEFTGLYDPARIAIINQAEFSLKQTEYTIDTSAFVHLLPESKPYDLRYTTSSTVDGFVVFSEIYYPKDWKAYIDGREVYLYRVNYVLRGLEVPAGKHKIQFKCINTTYQIGNYIGLVASLLIVTLVLGTVFYLTKSKQ